MANFGWAYINCADTGSADDILGDVSDVLFVTSQSDDTIIASGSSNFQWLTSSTTLVVSGSVIIEGALTASAFVSDINLTGSTYFGNDTGDVHIRTGSMYLLGAEISASTSISASEFYGDAGALTNLPLAGIFTQVDSTEAYTTSSVAVGATGGPDHTLSISGTLGTSGDITISGSSYLSQITASAGAYFGDNVGVGTSSPDYTLSVTGTLGVSGNTSISGNVDLGDARADITTINSQLTASRGLLVSNGETTILSGEVTASVGLFSDGNTVLGQIDEDITKINSQLTASKGLTVSAGYKTTIGGELTASFGIYADGNSSFGTLSEDVVTMNTQLTASRGGYFADRVGVGTNSPVDTLSVTGTLGVSDTAVFAGTASFDSDVNIGNVGGDRMQVNAAHISLSNVTASTSQTVLIMDPTTKAVGHDIIDSKVWDGKLIDYFGTPNSNNIAIMYDSNTIKSTGDLYWSDGPPAQLSIGGYVSASVGLTSSYISASNSIIASSFSASNTEVGVPDLTADGLIFIDATDSAYKSYGFSDYATAIAGAGLSATNGVLSTAGAGGGGIFTEVSVDEAYTTSSINIGAQAAPEAGFYVDVTGSTRFGNEAADTHIFTGSLSVITKSHGPGWATNYVVEVDTATQQFKFRGLRGGYSPVDQISHTASSADYILGVSASVSPGGDQDMDIRLPSASDAGEGALFVIKDEVLTRTTTKIYISASTPDTIDGELSYMLTGTLASINLYSNGTSGWFVF